MYPIWFSMTMVVLSIVVLFFMIVKLKIHPFITMTIVAVGLALAMGMPLIDPKTGIFAVMEPAMGKQLGHMVPLIALGCLIGEIIRRSGGSEVLGEKMLQRIGNRRGPLAMTMCGLLVGSTIFFDTAVILLAPVTIAVARQSKKSIIFFAIPMAIAVLGMHSIVPPHPGAVAIATALNVNFGLLIMYGLLAMVPGVGIAFLYSQWVAKKLTAEGTNRTIDVDAAYDGGGPTAVGAPDSTTPLPDGNARDAGPGGTSSPIATAVATATVRSTELTALEGHERPAVGKLLFVLLLPIVLILIQTLAGSVHVGGPAQAVLDILTFLGTPWLALTITVFFAYALLLTPRVRRGESISFFGMQGMKPVGEILVSTGGGVAFGSIIGASGVGKQLLDTLAEIHLPLVLFGFVLAAILRATLGTTTAAVTFVAVLLAQAFDTTILNPSQLALLAVGVSAGGMCLSNYSVDLQACTRAGTVATITPDGARGPVATATLSMLLSVLHNTVMKDRLVREKSWDLRERFMGTGLTGKTVGLLGVGNTGGELVRLLQPFGVRCVGYDPFCPPQRAIELGVELMELEDVAASCDALIVMAVLTEQTRHIVNAAILDQMKSTAVVINMARGPIINEQDLISALASGSIAAAGLDVFETEPVTNELVSMDNVTLSPHCLSWTDEMSLGNGSSCVRAIVAVANGRTPDFVINRDVLETTAFNDRLSLRAG